MRLSSTLSDCILKASSDGDSTTSLGVLFQLMSALNEKKNISYVNFPSKTYIHCHLPSPQDSLSRSLSSLWVLFKYWNTVMSPLSILFSTEKICKSFSLSLWSVFSSLWPPLQPWFGPFSICPYLSWIVVPRVGLWLHPDKRWVECEIMSNNPQEH